MPKQRALGRGQLVRPLLQIERELIDAWAAAHALPFVEDPSNLDTRLDRNFLRSEVLPVIARRWPSYVSTLLRAGALQKQALEDLNALPLATGVTCFNEPLLRFSGDIKDDQLASQLHRWLTLAGHLAPSHRRLRDFAQQALTAQADRRPELRLEHYRLCRWRDSIACRADIDQPSTSFNTDPPGDSELPLSCLVGEDVEGPWGRIYWRLSEGASGLPKGMLLASRQRQAGERLAPLNGRTKPYGQLCQERNVPPWWRHQLPIFTPHDSAVPLFAPALGQFAAMAKWNLEGEPLLLPFWEPPNGDSSIEPPPPN
jgi:tRNA(Ile)-lysidine synthase